MRVSEEAAHYQDRLDEDRPGVIQRCRCRVYFAEFGRRRYVVGLNERAVGALLVGTYAFEDKNAHRWRLGSELRDVPVAFGALDRESRTSRGTFHVFWHCPCCGEGHVTDVYLGAESAAIFFCDTSETRDVVLVLWDGTKQE